MIGQIEMGTMRVDRENSKQINSKSFDPQDRILTLAEVAQLLRIHRSTVSRLAKSGELRSYVIGSRRLFRESQIWEFFENRVDRIAQECASGVED